MEKEKIMYKLTSEGERKIAKFLAECKATRKEILDAGKDTAADTQLPTVEDILSDVNYGVGLDDDGEYYNCWGITDHHDSLLLGLVIGEDLRPDTPIDNVIMRAKDSDLLMSDELSFRMDLESAVKKFNLDLKEYLQADDMTFIHDIVGIQRNIKRTVYPATDFGFFVPRLAH